MKPTEFHDEIAVQIEAMTATIDELTTLHQYVG